MGRSRRAPAKESIVKGTRPMMGSVHPKPPVNLVNQRRKRQSAYSARHGFTPG